MWSTLWRAVELADEERARLTLVKTCDPGRAYVWVAPFAAGGAYVPPELESPEEAGRLLTCVAERVPASIPVTMLVLGPNTQRCLLQLLRNGVYGALVADASLLARMRRVRRHLDRNDLITVPIPCPQGPVRSGRRAAAVNTDLASAT